MRCISSYESYSIQVEEPDEEIVTVGGGQAKSIVRKKPVIADFQKTGLLDHEIEAALETFNFSGIPEGVSPLTRVSVFDTEMYAQANFKADVRDQRQAEIDARLRELSEIFPNDFIIVEHPAAARPWGKYDEQDLETILVLQEQTGISPETIRLYETEHLNRPQVIEAMWRLEDPEGAVELFGASEAEEQIAVSA